MVWDGKAWKPIKADAASAKSAQKSSESDPFSPSLGERLGEAFWPPRILSRVGKMAQAGVEKTEQAGLSERAKGHPIRAGAAQLAAMPLRTAESAGRIGGAVLSPFNVGAGATALAVPPLAPYIAGGFALSAMPDLFGGARPEAGESKADRDLSMTLPSPAYVERKLLAGATVAGGAAGVKAGAKSGTLDPGKTLASLESFRRMVEKKPTKANMDVAHTKHAELTAAINKVWEPIHKAMDKVPLDPDIVEAAIGKLRGLKPELDRWIDEMMPSGRASRRAPLWNEVKALSERLWELQGKDPVISSLAVKSRAGLNDAMRAAAKEQGMAEPYARARSLSRKMENVKFHTAYRATKSAPSFWEIGGAVAGGVAGEALAPGTGVGGLGGAYLGHRFGAGVGKRVSPEATYKIPKESIAAEEAIWKEIGEKPPASLRKRRIQVKPKTQD